MARRSKQNNSKLKISDKNDGIIENIYDNSPIEYSNTLIDTRRDRDTTDSIDSRRDRSTMEHRNEISTKKDSNTLIDSRRDRSAMEHSNDISMKKDMNVLIDSGTYKDTIEYGNEISIKEDTADSPDPRAGKDFIEHRNDFSMKEDSNTLIDPRKDISISDQPIQIKIVRRPLNPKEFKKFKKLEKEDPMIYEFHPELNVLEKKIFNLRQSTSDNPTNMNGESMDFIDPDNIRNNQKLDNIYDKNLDIVVDMSPILYLKTQLMSHQIYGISWMLNRENSQIRGGILADEMGLGKTLQMIGLMLKGNVGDINLVIVPSVALYQWINEIERHSTDIFKIHIYHGRTKMIEFTRSEDKINVILTTYGTVESSFRRKASQIHNLNFRRVILDEAHIIKDNKCSTTKAIMNLRSDYRWALTGTPVQNRVNDLLSLVKFLKIDPHSYYFCKRCPCKSLIWMRSNVNYNNFPNYENKKNENVEIKPPTYGRCECGHVSHQHFSWWNRKIANPIRELGHTDQNEDLFNRLHQTTRQIILRRTKNVLEKSLGLPSKVVIIKRCMFSPQELEFYTSLYTDIKTQYNSYQIRGNVTNNYAHIFELLQKMRMAVNHPFLTYKNSNLMEVPICGFCNCEADDPVKSKCNHYFCRAEVEIMLEGTGKCPVCHVPVSIDLENSMNFSEIFIGDCMNITGALNCNLENVNSLEAVKQVKDANFNKQNTLTSNWMSSTKVEMLLEMLNSFKSDGKSPKTIVFSQFVNFLEILRWRLERAGFRCVKIYGSMTISQRKAAIEAFNTNPEITVFLISLKAGGVALNLTEAENVFIMDLWWNPAVEEQAMDRIHRIGQFRPIRIYRMVIENSIESRVLILQQKKKALFETAVDNNMEALHRLSEDDLNFLFC